MRVIWHRGFVLGAMLSAGLIVGCSKSDEKVVAEVGDYKITVEEFKDLSQGMTGSFRTAEEEFEAKSEVLDSLVVQRLLVQAAYDNGLDKAEEVAQAVLANKDKFLLDALYKKHVADKAEVTEAELKDFYNKLEFKRRVSHILVSDKDTADALVKRISEGTSFEQLAFDYSEDVNAKRNRGDLGFMVYGALAGVPEFEDVAFALEPNEISPPVKSRFGYHIVRVSDQVPNEMRGEFGRMKSSLETQLKNMKQVRLSVAYMDAMRVKYPVTIDTNTASYIVHKRQDLYPPEVLRQLPTNDFDDSQLDRNERELVLATWEGGQITLIDYLTLSRRQPAHFRPSFDQYDSLQTAVFQAKLQDILVYEAGKEGIENDEDFKRKLSLFKELTMADVLRNDSIMIASVPKEDQLRQYYDAHPEEFTDPARVHVYEIQVSDELVANRLAREIKSQDAFVKKAAELTERPGKRANGGDLSYIIREWYPEIFDAAMATPVGGLAGPVFANGKYSVLYVIDKMESRARDFLAVKSQIAAKMQSEEEKERFSQWVKEHKEKTRIEIDTEALWTTIDREKYASSDTASVGVVGN